MIVNLLQSSAIILVAVAGILNSLTLMSIKRRLARLEDRALPTARAER